MFYIVVKFQNPSYNTFQDMNFFLGPVTRVGILVEFHQYRYNQYWFVITLVKPKRLIGFADMGKYRPIPICQPYHGHLDRQTESDA